MQHLTRDTFAGPRESAPTDAAFEKSPPWLVSTILHLSVLICLAVFSVGLPTDAGFELVLAPDLSSESPELDLGEAAVVEIPANDSIAKAVIDERPLELPSQQLFELNFGDLFSAAGNDNSSGLLQGFGSELGGKSGQGSTSVFGLEGEGIRFVYVFDRSDSMNSVFTVYNEDAIVRQVSPIGLAKQELLHSLDRLAEHHEFQVVFYNHTPRLFRPGYGDYRLFPATEENKQLAKEFVEAIPGEGNTNHWAALQAALTLRPDVVFLITDGEAKDDPPLYQIISMAEFCNRKHILVNVIHFSNVNRPSCTLVRLAEETGGQHLFIDLKSFLAAAN